MGLEFMPIFKDWAVSYDDEVEGHNPQYKDVFEGYWDIITEIINQSGNSILEFGSGTGNLTEKLLQAGKKVYPIEPSQEMRAIAQEKLKDYQVEFLDGDMENFPQPENEVDTIVSNLVFHHLNAAEKNSALAAYNKILPSGGKIIFGDTMFLSQAALDAIIERESSRGFEDLVEDLNREYYPLITDLEEIFRANNFKTTYRQMNNYVWIVIAEKIN